jgi:(p)ppGpp synthase/HD superfamily hydrolase
MNSRKGVVNNSSSNQNFKPHFGLYQAIKLAKKAHETQLDREGKPYFFHPITVMAMLDTEEEMIVGVLHDVVEDTPVTLEDLREAGASEEIISAVDAISKRNEEDLETYWARVKANPLARRVKLMDATHNADSRRLAQFESEDKREKFRIKYATIIDLMSEN